MEKDKSFLGTQPVGKLLFKLSLPTVIAQIVNMLYNIVDRIYIGHMPGDGSLALTGVGVCLPIIMIISAFAAFVSAGGAPRASISMGKGDNDSAEKILGGCFSMQIVISAVLTALLLIFDRDLLLAFGASENTIEYAVDYMNIYAIGTVFVQLTLGMNAFITAQGFANIGMVTVMIGAVSNIVLDPIFIFGLHMGVRGAALATIISQCVSCVWVVAFLFGKKTILRLKAKNFFVSPKIILPCITLGLATFIMQSSESVISVCFNSSLLKYGGDIAVGAMTILTSVMQFAMLPLNGISQGSQPILSYNYGAGNSERVKKTFKLLLAVCLTYSFLLWGFIELFPQGFARMFSSDAALIGFTAHALRIYCAVLCLFGIQMSCQMAFVSIGIYAIGTVFVQLTLGMNAFITAQGFANIGMVTVMIGAVSNIVLDPIFIFGLHMGVRGAALATIISQCVSCVWVVAFLFGKKTILRLKAKNFFVSPKIILPCITLGLATFIMQSSESVISVCFNSSLLKYGGDIAVGAMTILTSVMQFAMLPLNGISQGSQPILSYNYGAGNSERVKKTFKLLLAVCLTYSFLLWGFIELFPQGFARMFSSDAALIGFTAHALRIYCAVLCLFGIQMSCQMAFVSIGSALCSISVAVVRKFVLLLPLIYIMPAFVADKTMGVYMAEPVADVIAITFTSILFTIQFGKAMKKLEAQKKGEAK